MSAAWSISHPLRLVVIVAKGEFDQTDFSRVRDSIDRANAAGYQNIVDITGMTSAPPQRSLHEFAAIVRAREAGRTAGPIAIVARSAEAARCANAFALRARDRRLISVFPDQCEARRWLGSFYAFEREGTASIQHRAAD